MNGSRNESTARKMARGKTQTAAERRACMNFHRKFIWFGKICGSIPLELQKSSPSSKKATQTAFFIEKPSFTTVWGEPLGNLGESTARNRPCGKWPGKINFLFRVFCFSRKWPVGTSILLESGIVLEFSTAKTLESGIVLTPKRLRVVSFLNLGYQFRLRNASFLTLK